MANRLYLLFELLYGAALLTTIASAPDILMKLRLNNEIGFTVTFRYPGIWLTLLWSLVLTALAMLPTVVMLPKRLTRRRIFNFLPLAPWILICCLKFLTHASMHAFAIRHVAQFNDSKGLIMALAIYCIMFGMSVEMMLHWIAIANLSQAGFLLVVRPELN